MTRTEEIRNPGILDVYMLWVVFTSFFREENVAEVQLKSSDANQPFSSLQ